MLAPWLADADYAQLSRPPRKSAGPSHSTRPLLQAAVWRWWLRCATRERLALVCRKGFSLSRPVAAAAPGEAEVGAEVGPLKALLSSALPNEEIVRLAELLMERGAEFSVSEVRAHAPPCAAQLSICEGAVSGAVLDLPSRT